MTTQVPRGEAGGAPRLQAAVSALEVLEIRIRLWESARSLSALLYMRDTILENVSATFNIKT